MTKFNVGDKVRIVRKVEDDCALSAKVGDIVRITGKYDGVYYPIEYNGGIHGYMTPGSIAPISGTVDRRLTEAEAKIATLEAEVKALKGASKPTFSERFPKAHAELKQSPNSRRADVIKRAQAFVADLEKRSSGFEINRDGNDLFNDCVIKLTFHINSEKGVVTALAHDLYSGKLLAKAFAKCAPGDVFNADIGKAIAAGYLFGVKVPKEFTDAVKPTEVVVGHKVRGNNFGVIYEVNEFHKDVKLDGDYGAAIAISGIRSSAWVGTKQVTIIDDSDAVYL